MYDLVITNGLVVTASDVAPLDIAIKGEKIALLAPSGTLADQGSKVIDAAGGYVMPGGIDCHVHLQEPPLFGKGTSADTYETGTRSAIAGGNTTLVTFAPLQKETESTPLSVVADTRKVADGESYCDFSFHVLLGNADQNTLADFPKLREEGISSVKIYMTYKALQLNDGDILSVLLAARKNKILTMIHAENGEVLDWLTSQLEAAQLFAPKYHSNSRPPVLEAEATNRAIALSSLIANTPILLVHVSDVGATARIREAQSAGQPIYAETCPQYLYLTRDDLDKPGFEGAKCVCSPPPRDKKDQEAIWNGLSNGTFEILSSDHCPFRFDDAESGKKTCITHDHPVGQFKYIPNGLPGVETRMPLALSGAGEKLHLTKFVQVTSTNAAKLYGLYPRKGALIPGVSDADVTIWYPSFSGMDITVTNEMLHHDVDYTPYEGQRVSNWPRYTIIRGRVVWDREGGGIIGEKGYGRFIKRDAAVGVWREDMPEFNLKSL
ncbi:hypothetical protein BDW69DRAFT_201323 [Aspergillus filifer]